MILALRFCTVVLAVAVTVALCRVLLADWSPAACAHKAPAHAVQPEDFRP